MNESDLGTLPLETAPVTMPYKNRYPGLIVFGILTILLGCLAGLFVPLMLVGMEASAKATNTPAPLATLLPAMSIYGLLAVALIWLGVGSIMARRWARALLLIFSWTWLVMGVLVTISLAFILPKTLRNLPANGQPPVPVGAILAGMFMVFGVIFVLLPAVWTFFYRSPHVKATCEMRDPVTRWTDACPLPVLGFCLWLVVSIPMMLLLPLVGHGVMPFFGTFLMGIPGSLLYLIVAAIWTYAAWSLYHLESRGWWVILIAMGLFMVSTFLTYARHDVTEMYRLMGYPEAQISQIQQTGLLTGNNMQWLTLASIIPLVIYMLWIKRYLKPKA